MHDDIHGCRAIFTEQYSVLNAVMVWDAEEEKKRFNTSFVDRTTALSREEWDAFKAWTSGTTDGSPGKELLDRDSANENGPGPLTRVSSLRFDEKTLKISLR
jgi:hypothetical protein